jgi:hypothetical protein
MCLPTDVTCHVFEGVSGVAKSALDNVAQSIGRAAIQGLDAVSTFWIKEFPSPTLATGSGQNWQNSHPVGFLADNTWLITAAVFTLAVLVAGMRIAWEQRAKPLQDLLKSILLFVVVGSAGTAIMQQLVEWSDELAVSLVSTSLPKDTSFSTAIGTQVMHGALNIANPADPRGVIMIWVGLAVLFAALIQVVLMVIRSAMLILLAGTFPLAAAATNTEMGKAWFRKYCGWAIGFIAYKPAAALIYATALRMNGPDVPQAGNGVVQALTGVMMLFLAIFALPALLRFMVPVTAAVAGGSAGMGSTVADPGGVATGAINVGRARLGGSGGSGGGAAGASAGGKATGAIGVGAAASGGLAVAGAGINGARKAGGALAGAAAHSAGESGGGSITPTSSSGAMSRGGSRARSSGSGGSSSSAGQGRVAESAGPRGSR